jgi:GNAT superfamily N-acetyltransferase
MTTLDPVTSASDALLPAGAVVEAAEGEGDGLPPRRAELAVDVWRVPHPKADRRIEVLGDVDDPDGVLVFELDTTAENRHVAFLSIAVPADRRRQGCGRALVEHGLRLAGDADRRTVLTVSFPEHEQTARAFGPAVGFEPALVMRGSTLRLDEVDREMVARWATTLHEEYDVLLFEDRIPDDHIAAHIEAAHAMNDAPRDGLDVADDVPDPRMTRYWEEITAACEGRRLSALAVHRETGAGAGFSTVWWEPGRHTIVWQGGTGVAAAHRGRALGRVLKARVIERLAVLAPDATEIRTDNAHTNPWMLRINDDLGFRPHGDVIEWQRKL